MQQEQEPEQEYDDTVAEPLWKTILYVAMIIAAGAFLIGKLLEPEDSPEAKRMKAQLKPIAQLLERSNEVGHLLGRNTLNDSISDFLAEYNALSPKAAKRLNESPAFFCVLAVFSLSKGMDEIEQTGEWITRQKYKNAISLCR